MESLAPNSTILIVTSTFGAPYFVITTGRKHKRALQLYEVRASAGRDGYAFGPTEIDIE
jgi:hypothetical protein